MKEKINGVINILFLMSAVPIVEQRGAIPMGIFAYNMNQY